MCTHKHTYPHTQIPNFFNFPPSSSIPTKWSLSRFIPIPWWAMPKSMAVSDLVFSLYHSLSQPWGRAFSLSYPHSLVFPLLCPCMASVFVVPLHSFSAENKTKAKEQKNNSDIPIFQPVWYIILVCPNVYGTIEQYIFM